MWTKLPAASLAVFQILLFAQPARAEWKELLVRTFGPPLMNRAINYLSKKKRSYQSQSQQQPQYSQVDYSPQYSAPKAWTPQQTWKPKPKAAAPKQGTPPNKVPPKPVVTPEEMGLVPPPPTKGQKSSSGKLEIPPPPKMMVPPPPPGVPTGAILGLYPEELNKLHAEHAKSTPKASPKPSERPEPPMVSAGQSEVAEMPKLAPDFRRASKSKQAK